MAHNTKEVSELEEQESIATTSSGFSSPREVLRRSARNLPTVEIIEDSDESSNELSFPIKSINSIKLNYPKNSERDISTNASTTREFIKTTNSGISSTITTYEAKKNLLQVESVDLSSCDAFKPLERSVSMWKSPNSKSNKRKRTNDLDEDNEFDISSPVKQKQTDFMHTEKDKGKAQAEIPENPSPFKSSIKHVSTSSYLSRDTKRLKVEEPSQIPYSVGPSSVDKGKSKEIAPVDQGVIKSQPLNGFDNDSLHVKRHDDAETYSDSDSLFPNLRSRSKTICKISSPQKSKSPVAQKIVQIDENSVPISNTLLTYSDVEDNFDSDCGSLNLDCEREIFSDDDIPISDIITNDDIPISDIISNEDSLNAPLDLASRHNQTTHTSRRARGPRRPKPPKESRAERERKKLEYYHPDLMTMWEDLEKIPKIGDVTMKQPANISRELKPFQLQGVAWMKAMEQTKWGGGLLGDEMGMGKTIQAVSLIMSDWPAKQPSLVLIPPVALLQWQQEINSYTDGTLKTFVYHCTNAKLKGIKKADLIKYDVILMSYNSLESMYRKQEKGFKRKVGSHKEKSVIHEMQFHRVILDEAHNIKSRTCGSARACFALQAKHKWCLSGTPLQNRIGEFFSLVRFLDIKPFTCYLCKQCPCSIHNWDMDGDHRCKSCNHNGMQHVSVFNYELLNPIQKYGNYGPGAKAFQKLRLLTDRFMLRRIKRDHTNAMELPAKEIYINRQFFGEEENDFASSVMSKGTRKFETYVAQGVLLNNYAHIFGLILQMRQVADHPDLILKKNSAGDQNVLVCCICDETAEGAIRSACRHDFCRECARNYVASSDKEIPDCPQCHIQLSIDLEQPDIEQDNAMIKKSSIINRIKMENWVSSTKIETLVHELYKLRSKNMSHKSIIFSQFTTMLQLVEWRLRRAGISTVMLDGSMTPSQRQASINHFMTDVSVECFLVSLKAGGVALNLTEASKVFIVDPWWNPAAEWQSADRCHRIGQSRPCSVTRLCIEDSVESRMVLLQEKKANMINSTINSDESAIENLTPEDLQFLFRGN
ncbi:P-loop containing nucleoside triphosphate hydrolase [Erysiphe pulchra]|uniref:P-loop containing nucleoside triphosphate hydrolase n=1 Tax=Erysiphe pulchra TaxID=225359 RepID=A0A2S4PZ33_9PEZI|nr:P-loop containing nucleoside triphosphate hydrolase [Erysiphe pulchra]